MNKKSNNQRESNSKNKKASYKIKEQENQKENLLQEAQEAYNYEKLTYEEAEKIVNGEYRYELIDGEIYAMSSPSFIHQEISMKISFEFMKYFQNKPCKPCYAPLDVILNKDSRKTAGNVLQPDIMVICNKSYIHEDGIYGPPKLVVEILSQDTYKDRIKKYNLYMTYGVSEYWIVDPENKLTQVYVLNKNSFYELNGEYSFNEEIHSSNFKELKVVLNENGNVIEF